MTENISQLANKIRQETGKGTCQNRLLDLANQLPETSGRNLAIAVSALSDHMAGLAMFKMPDLNLIKSYESAVPAFGFASERARQNTPILNQNQTPQIE